METNSYLPHTLSIFEKAQETAQALDLKSVDMDIFVAAYLENLSLGCVTIINNPQLIIRLITESFDKINRKKAQGRYESVYFTPKVKRFIESCEDIAFNVFDLDYVAPEVIFINLLSPEFATKAFKDNFYEDGAYNDTAEELIERTAAYIRDQDAQLFPPILTQQEQEIHRTTHQEGDPQFLDMFAETKFYPEFAENLNVKAAKGDFDRVIDFDGKIEELTTILCRKKKPNAILVGPAGTGKTSLVEGLAHRIVHGEAPELISNKVIYSLSLSSMVAGTQFRGQFEERLENFVNEAKKYENLILFIDEVHTLVGAGGSQENSLEASNILKPELARGTISCIGATTVNEYTNTIKKDSALDRRFERVAVREPSKFQMKQILPSLVEYYEEFHHVKYSEEFLDNVIDYCERFMPNKCYPDKAVDVVDHCGAQAKVHFWQMDESMQKMKNEILESPENSAEGIQKFNEFEEAFAEWAEKKDSDLAVVEIDELKSFFDKKENPLNKKEIVEDFFKSMKNDFVGNRKSIKSLKESLVLSNFGFQHSDSGVPIFCLNGLKYSGKSMFLKLLKESLEVSGVNILAFNGVHFSDQLANYKIIPERNNNTSLCEKVFMHPNSVIIIDDFHKINPSTYNLFTEIFKEGRIQMNSGDIADFSNCKFFLTSDVVAEKSMGFTGSTSDPQSLIGGDLTKYFTHSAFLGEFDKRDLRRVLWNKLEQNRKSFNMKGVELKYDFTFIKDFVENLPSNDFNIKLLNEKFEQTIKKYTADQILEGKTTINLKKMPEKP